MTDDICEGCGVPLQSERPDAPGYVPAHVLSRGEPVVCQRCFRITNYGKEETVVKVDEEDAWSTVLDVIDRVDAVIMIVDIVDFEGTYLTRLAQYPRRLLVAVNKVDLLPSKTPPEEVAAWVKDRLAADGIEACGVFPVSARDGFGTRQLLDGAKRHAGRGGRVGLVGATNVGKSTLLSRWLKPTGEPGPTVSRIPGTTLGAIPKQLAPEGIEIVDTPGLTPGQRVTDHVCRACAQRLVPDRPLSSKLLKLAAGQSAVIGGIAAFTPLESDERIVLLFAASEVPIHRVKEVRVDRWLRGEPIPGQTVLCEACRAAIAKVGWEEIVVEVGEMEDVAVHGLGWLSPRRSGLKVRALVPAGTMLSVRPRLIGPKTPAALRA
ncbi:MAG: hypothetical protein CW345_02525 [Firmicutes bacterium]|nr:hypothetical protein [Bacillota bacterium]MBO2520671.1 hypothetical protein [Bacillota bacterium]